jgi:divalent metal cation (Fe/Co/Zn/Cd) transporter
LIGFLILYNAWGILRETVEILLESTPRDVDIKKMVAILPEWRVCSVSMTCMSGASHETCGPCPLIFSPRIFDQRG